MRKLKQGKSNLHFSKILTLSFLILLSPLITIGQTSLGLKGGLSISEMQGENSSRMGLFGGGYFKPSLNNIIFLQTELLYAQKGVEYNQFSLGAHKFDFSFRYDYLSLPLLAGIKVSKTLSFHLGPEVSYLLAIQSQLDDKTFYAKGISDPDFDIGFLVGGEFQVKRIGFYARYIFGFTEMPDWTFFDINGLTIVNIDSRTHLSLQAGISYQLY